MGGHAGTAGYGLLAVGPDKLHVGIKGPHHVLCLQRVDGAVAVINPVDLQHAALLVHSL